MQALGAQMVHLRLHYETEGKIPMGPFSQTWNLP